MPTATPTPTPTPSNQIPSLDALSYRFSNSSSAFGYPSRYKIPYERFSLVFGDTVKAKILYEEAGYWGGNCYGMSSTSGLFFQNGNDADVSSFRSGATRPYGLSINDRNSNWNLTAKEFIEAMQISQYADQIQRDYRWNTDLEDIFRSLYGVVLPFE